MLHIKSHEIVRYDHQTPYQCPTNQHGHSGTGNRVHYLIPSRFRVSFENWFRSGMTPDDHRYKPHELLACSGSAPQWLATGSGAAKLGQKTSA